MTMAITTVENVRCYVDEQNTAWLNAEDVARGLGWVDYQEKVSATGCRKTYEVIRWATVNRYLKEFGFSADVSKDVYIPENMFYRLAMKASNAAAQKFQAKVADVILPAIRKNGVYMTLEAAEKILYNPDFIIGLAQQVKDANAKIAFLQPKADYCEKVLESKEHLTSELIAKEYGQRAQWLHEVLGKQGKIYKRGRHIYMKAPFDKEGYRTSETVTLERGKTVVNHYWTQKGRWFIYNTLKKIGIVPLDERETPMATLL